MPKEIKEKLNFAFWGTPDVASETLETLKENGYLPSLIITSPDKPQGRKMIITPPPVKIWAEKNNIPYLQPEKLDGEFSNKLKSVNYKLFIVVAYGKIIPEDMINMPKLGSINIHYSLLPKYRGASPVESAILNGEEETGVTIQQMEYKMDSGPIIATEKLAIMPEEKAEDLRKRLIKIGSELLIKKLPEIIEGNIKLTPQNENEATYCKKIKKEDGLIDLNDNATKNYNKFRAYAHWPRTYFFVNNRRIIITDASLEDGNFVIKKVLPEGKKEIKYEDFLKSNI
ncbi:methionyl-tRNA formyltransferase [Candidatus Nomurabacteria bacterium]|nr:methionyl-tRNA formyltransferase [Candidatus Nomurabacteria bacterium]